MTIHYGLIPNHLNKNTDSYMGIVTDNESVNIETIVEYMIGKGSTVTKAEALSVIEEFEHAVSEFVKNGNRVNTNLFKIKPSVSGIFTDKQDHFDPNRHSIDLNMNAGPRLKEIIPEIKLKKVDITSPQPVLKQFVDLKTGTLNQSFTSGEIASIQGRLLKFNPEDNQQGIFFIAADGREIKVDHVIKNKPSELLFFVPEGLTRGSFTVEVRTVIQNTKTIRKGILKVALIPTN